MNIKKFNEQFNVNDLLNLAISKNWKQFDQDLFNYICGDNVKILDAKKARDIMLAKHEFMSYY